MHTNSQTLLFGGVRSVTLDRKDIQTLLERLGQQSSEGVQTSEAFAGSIATNDLNQLENVNQQGSTSSSETITVSPPQLPSGGIPQHILDHFKYLARNENIFRITDFLTQGKGVNDQVQQVGQVALSDGMDAQGVESTALNTLNQNATILQTLSQVGSDVTFTSQMGTLPAFVSRDRETVVEFNNASTEGILNITQSQGAPPAVSAVPGAREVISSSSAFQDATTGPGTATAATKLNDLTLNTVDYVPGDKITITGVDFGGATVTADFVIGGGAREIVTGALALTDSGATTNATAGSPATVGTPLKDTNIASAASYVPGDTILISGTDANGNAVSQKPFVFGTGTGQDGTTVGDMINKISSVFPGATASLDSAGKIVLKADSPGAITPDLALALTNQSTNTGNSVQSAFGAFSVSEQGAPPGNGDTLGDLIDFVNGAGKGPNGQVDKFPGATLSLSAGKLVLTADQTGAANLMFALADAAGNTGQTSFRTNTLVEITPGLAPFAGSTIPSTSFQMATANEGFASNFLNETVSNVQNNTVMNTQTIDLRKISGTALAALTPRPDVIRILMNSPAGQGKTGQVNRVANIGNAVQRQSLIQTARGGVDKDGVQHDNDGKALNVATQMATSTDNATVSDVTNIMA